MSSQRTENKINQHKKKDTHFENQPKVETGSYQHFDSTVSCQNFLGKIPDENTDSWVFYKGMGLMEHVNLDRLERLIHIPVHSRPDWLKNAREDAEELLWLACRASTNQDLASLEELDQEAGIMAERLQYRMDNEL